jgi:hypothetical protein
MGKKIWIDKEKAYRNGMICAIIIAAIFIGAFLLPTVSPPTSPFGDPDGDEIPNWLDPDDDGDGVPDTEDPAPFDPEIPPTDEDLEGHMLVLTGTVKTYDKTHPNTLGNPGQLAWNVAFTTLQFSDGNGGFVDETDLYDVTIWVYKSTGGGEIVGFPHDTEDIIWWDFNTNTWVDAETYFNVYWTSESPNNIVCTEQISTTAAMDGDYVYAKLYMASMVSGPYIHWTYLKL